MERPFCVPKNSYAISSRKMSAYLFSALSALLILNAKFYILN